MKLSISEFAEQAGVTKQAIYKRRKTDARLNAMIESINGNLMIDTAAFDIIGTKVKPSAAEDAGAPDAARQIDILRQQYDHRIELLELELHQTQARITDKDSIIANLTAQLTAKDAQIEKALNAEHEAHVLVAQVSAQLTEALKPKGIRGWFTRLLPGKSKEHKDAGQGEGANL